MQFIKKKFIRDLLNLQKTNFYIRLIKFRHNWPIILFNLYSRVTVHFAEGYFTETHFTEAISPKGRFAEETFRRKSISSKDISPTSISPKSRKTKIIPSFFF